MPSLEISSGLARRADHHPGRLGLLPPAADPLVRTQRRAVHHRLEYGAQGANPRFVATNITGSDAMQLYERLYCARGEAENRIKEVQLDLFGTRVSCHRFPANSVFLKTTLCAKS